MPFFIIVFISIFVGYYVNNYTVNRYRTNVLNSYSTVFKNNVATVDSKLEKMEDTIDSIALNNDVEDFFNKTEVSFSELVKIKDILNSYNFDKEIVRNIYVYNSKTDAIIDINRAYTSKKQFYDSEFLNTSTSYEEWSNDINSTEWVRKYFGTMSLKDENVGNTKKKIQYVRSIPLKRSSVAKGKIYVVLNDDILYKTKSELDNLTSGETYILDDSKNILFGSNSTYYDYIINETALFNEEFENKEIVINNEKMYVSNIENSRGGFEYINIVPKKSVVESAKWLNLLVLAVYFLTFLLCMGYSIYLTYEKTHEISAIMNAIGKYGVKLQGKLKISDIHQTEYSYIKDGIDELISHNDSISDKLALQNEQLKTNVFTKLINGNYESEEEVKKAFENVGMLARDSKYVCIAILLGHEYRMKIGDMTAKEFVIDVCNTIIMDYNYVYDISAKSLAIIISMDGSNEEITRRIESYIAQAEVEITYGYDIEITFGISNIFEKRIDLDKAFKNAKSVLDYNKLDYNKKILWYDTLKNNADQYYYPLKLENKLYNYTLIGNKNEVQNTLDDIYIENFVNRKLSIDTINQLINEIYGTIFKIQDSIFTGDNKINVSENFSRDESIVKIFEKTNILLHEYCDIVLESNSSKNNSTLNQIILYIDENYKDPQLSLSFVAEKFGINEKYLSGIFKKHTNENFSIYIERLRIEKAKQLISNSKYQISDISSMVGYVSDVTFRRAFKRVTGLAPSAYAKQLKE
ncbi:MAG: AraC family transcriptional regulator [Oscillospiraceae bacterium]